MTSGGLSLWHANGLAMEDKKMFVDLGLMVFEVLRSPSIPCELL